MIFRHLQTRYLWARLKVRFLDKDYEGFLRNLPEFENRRDLRPHQTTMKAVALLIIGEHDRALQLFKLAQRQADGGGTPDADYVSNYCRAQILALKGQLDASQAIEASMKNIDCHRELHRLLPYE